MRETRNAQTSIFDFYAKHEHANQLKALSELLDTHSDILKLVDADLRSNDANQCGATGLSSESVFRCLILKQMLQISYERLAFHLSDSMTYRTFCRLKAEQNPSRSGLQSTVRRIRSQTLECIHQCFIGNWIEQGTISAKQLRIDSTVVESNIAPPSDSQMLNDGIRVLSRLLATARKTVGVKVRLTDQRKRSKSLAFRIFNAKGAEKVVLYPQLLCCAKIVIKQVDRTLVLCESVENKDVKSKQWLDRVKHYRHLLMLVMEQTTRRVIYSEKVASAEKIVSLFEEHTDIIVKGFRDTQYGHKINIATQENGFATHLAIESRNPSDKELFMPVLIALEERHGVIPTSTSCDGGYASRENVHKARAFGVQQVAFNKRVGLGCHEMGVKEKSLKKLRDFRAGIEGNISELKRAYGMSKVTWKGPQGFNAFVWSSVLSYNLMRRVRFDSG